MKKLLTFLMFFLLAAVAAQAEEIYTAEGISGGQVTLSGYDLSYHFGGYYYLKINKNGGTAPTYNTTGKDIRVYAKGTATLSTTGSNPFGEIVFSISAAGKKRLAEITASTGSVSIDNENWTVTWTGEASEVTFTVGDHANYGTDGDTKAGQLDFDKLQITTKSTTGPVDASWSVSPTPVSVAAGNTATATITTNYDGTLSVSSNDQDVATATISGKVITVTGVAAGNTTLTVTGAATSTYNAISKTIDVTVTAPRPENEIFYESFDTNDGTGGNDEQWSGSIAANNIKQDNEGWVFENGSGAKECAKFGAGSKLGTATTPALGQACNATLTFKAAAWNGGSESTTLKLSVIGGGSISPATVTMTKGAWTTYEVTLTSLTADSKVKFEGNATSNSRFFLDEISIVKTGEATPEKTLSSIAVKTAPTKVTYTEGENFDPAGLVITATYDKGDPEDIAYAGNESKFTFVPALDAALATDNKSVTITYGDKSVEQAITVNAKVVPVYASLAELVAAGAPTEAGAPVTVTLTNEEITSIFVTQKGYRNGIFLKSEEQEVEIYCYDVPESWVEGGKVSGTLTNCDWKLYNGTWELCPADWSELTYTAPVIEKQDPTFSIENMTIEENSEDNTPVISTNNTDEYTIEYTSSNEEIAYVEDGKVVGFGPGECTITAVMAATTHFNEATTTFRVTVTPEKTITALEISGTPTKTTYNVGDAFDPAGLVVTATYSDETTAPITTGFEWEIDYGTGNEAFVAGATSVDVMAYIGQDVMSGVYTVNGLTVNVPVTLTSLVVSGTPTKTEYVEGDTFDPAGLVVTGTYSDSHQEVITEGIEWTVDPETLEKGITEVYVLAGIGAVLSEIYPVTGIKVLEAETYTFAEFSNENNEVIFEANGYIIKMVKGQSSNSKPAWINSQARLYAGGYVDVTSTCGRNIVKIVYNYEENAGGKNNTVPTIDGVAGATNAGDWDAETKTWTGKDKTVTLTTSGTAGNLGFTSITVYFADNVVTYSVGFEKSSTSASPIKLAEGVDIVWSELTEGKDESGNPNGIYSSDKGYTLNAGDHIYFKRENLDGTETYLIPDPKFEDKTIITKNYSVPFVESETESYFEFYSESQQTECYINIVPEKNRIVIKKGAIITAVYDINVADKGVKAYKVIENGQVVIVRGDQRFNIMGQPIR